MPTLVHVTDLHLDNFPENLEAMLELVQDIPAELFLVGGDNGFEDGITATVQELRRLRPAAAIAWVMGNHDLWQRAYTDLWLGRPRLDATYLELENLEDEAFTVVGTYGHYDYSGGTSKLTHEQYETFTDGYHIWNDRYIDRLGKTNPQIAREIADRFRARYRSALARGLPLIVLTHTLPFATADESKRSFVTAYCANQMIGDILLAEAEKPLALFCGHTHRARRSDEFGFPVINTGSDYRDVRITRWEF